MARSSYKTGRYTIAPGGEITVQRAANYLICLESTAPFLVRFDDGTVSDFEAGLTLRQPEGFTKLAIVNTTDHEIAIHLGFGLGDVRDSRMTITGVLDTNTVSPARFIALPSISVGAGAVAQIAAERPSRVEIGVTNNSAGKIWVRGDSVAAGDGQPVEAGQTVILNTSAALHIFNEGATPAPVAAWQTEHSF